MKVTPWSGLCSTLVVLVASACAVSEESSVSIDSGEDVAGTASAILGGSKAETCQLPSVVTLRSCTAALIHPRVVLYAAHCGTDQPTVRFSNTRATYESPQLTVHPGAPARTVNTERCEVHPDYVGFHNADVAYCILETAVNDVPIIPVLPPSAVPQAAFVGAKVVIAGYGIYDTKTNSFGVKHWAEQEISGLPEGRVQVRGQPQIARGDSGGSMLTRLADGTWWSIGIASGFNLNADPTTSTFAAVAEWLPWLEEKSGFDLSPCFDAEGKFSAGPNCKNVFSGEVTDAFGTYDGTPTCEGTEGQVPSIQVSTTCTNGVKDGTETDVDCGGGCAPCDITQSCSIDLECKSGKCHLGVCSIDCSKLGPYQVGKKYVYGDMVFEDERVWIATKTIDYAQAECTPSKPAGFCGTLWKDSGKCDILPGEEPPDGTGGDTSTGGMSATGGASTSAGGAAVSEGGAGGVASETPKATGGVLPTETPTETPDAPDSPTVESEGGCGCRTAGGGDASRASTILLGLGLVAALRLRRRATLRVARSAAP